MATKNNQKSDNGAILGFEQKLWQAADRLRGHIDPSQYRDVVLGLIFLKYISDAFNEKYAELEADEWGDPEDRDEYLAANIFWVPKKARWKQLQNNARSEKIGELIDEAMIAIEQANKDLKGMLPKDYARPTLNKQRLGELVDLVGTIGLGGREQQSQDVLGRVYEYFLGEFAQAEGKRGGQYYTPPAVVRLLVEMIEPFEGRIYDPCCGSGGMFVQSTRFVKQHGGQARSLAIYGQESNPTTWRLCKINLAIRGISHDLGEQNADSFLNDLHPHLKADFILANPPFNMKVWGGNQLDKDVRWQYGTPPSGNANYAWIQHIIHHLAPDGIAGFVLANGSLSSSAKGEGDIRQAITEVPPDLVDCIVALPGQLFYTTQIPASLWFLNRNKISGTAYDGTPLHDRRGEVLFIDARNMGHLIDRTHRELSDDDIARITSAYHSWRGQTVAHPDFADGYVDISGFCKSAAVSEIDSHDFVLTPGRYVGIAETKEDDRTFEEKLDLLSSELAKQFAKSRELETRISSNLEALGYEL